MTPEERARRAVYRIKEPPPNKWDSWSQTELIELEIREAVEAEREKSTAVLAAVAALLDASALLSKVAPGQIASEVATMRMYEARFEELRAANKLAIRARAAAS